MKEFSQQIANAFRSVTKTAITPGLFLVLILILGAIPLSIYGEKWVGIWIMMLLTVAVVSVTLSYLLHTFRNPQLLQSEEYLLKKDAITIYGSSSFEGRQIVDIVSSATPSLPPPSAPKEED